MFVYRRAPYLPPLEGLPLLASSCVTSSGTDTGLDAFPHARSGSIVRFSKRSQLASIASRHRQSLLDLGLQSSTIRACAIRTKRGDKLRLRLRTSARTKQTHPAREDS